MAANNEAQRRGDDGAKDGDAQESQFATPTSTAALGWCVWRPGSALFLHAPSALGGWSLNCAHTASKSAAVVIVLAVLGWVLGLRRPWTVDGWRGFLRKLRASLSSAPGAIAAAQSIEGGPAPRLQH